jgi:hypothetical protein
MLFMSAGAYLLGTTSLGGENMNFAWAWKGVLIVIVGSMLLRLAGCKSIAQMTVAQTIIMIAIGNLLIQPVSERGLLVTFATGLVLVLTLLAMEYAQVKSDVVETVITGRSVIVIRDGILDIHVPVSPIVPRAYQSGRRINRYIKQRSSGKEGPYVPRALHPHHES